MWGPKMEIERMYERFFELPISVVLVVLWFAGLAVVIPWVVTFYLCVSALVGMLLGA
jgi:hypothetical protein